MADETNGWSKAEKMVIFRLDAIDERMGKMADKIDKMSEDTIILKMKAWMFGIIGGSVIAAVFEVILAIIKGKL